MSNFDKVDPKVREVIKLLEENNIPSAILTINTEEENLHLGITGMGGYIGVVLENIFCTVKENNDPTPAQVTLVRMIFASLVRSYSQKELDQRLVAWRRRIENDDNFNGI